MQPHEVLGVAPGASPQEVRAAFRRFATTNHPDCGGDAARFSAGVDAYRRLTSTAPPVRDASSPSADVVFHRSRRGLKVLGVRRRRRARTGRHLH